MNIFMVSHMIYDLRSNASIMHIIVSRSVASDISSLQLAQHWQLDWTSSLCVSLKFWSLSFMLVLSDPSLYLMDKFIFYYIDKWIYTWLIYHLTYWAAYGFKTNHQWANILVAE